MATSICSRPMLILLGAAVIAVVADRCAVPMLCNKKPGWVEISSDQNKNAENAMTHRYRNELRDLQARIGNIGETIEKQKARMEKYKKTLATSRSAPTTAPDISPGFTYGPRTTICPSTDQPITTKATTAADVNECAQGGGNDCHRNASCSNTDGSFKCVCNTGFTGDGTKCEDVDECSSGGQNNCHSNASCSNTDGTFKCECNTGFTGDGTKCEERQYEADGWTRASNGCYYKFFGDEDVENEVARSRCKDLGGRLASSGLQTAALRAEVKALIPSPFQNTWIGLNDLAVQGTYVWSDGVISTSSNTDWGPNEGHIASERCAGMHSYHDGAIADLACSSKRKYLCEICG